MARRCCALMRRYCARSAPWRPPDRRSPTASAMRRRIPDQRATLPVVRARSDAPAAGERATPRRLPIALPDGRAPYLQTFLGPFLRQLCEQQSPFAVQVAPDGKHAGSVVVVLLVDDVVVVVAGTVVVVVGAAVAVVVVVDTVVVVVVVASVVVVVVPGRVVVVVVLGRVVV